MPWEGEWPRTYNMCFWRSEDVYWLWHFKIRVPVDTQGFKVSKIFKLIQIQPDSLEGHLVMLSRLLCSPGFQSTDARFLKRAVYLQGSEGKARAGWNEKHSWSVAKGVVCGRHWGCVSSSGSCAKIKVIIPRAGSWRALTAEARLEKVSFQKFHLRSRGMKISVVWPMGERELVMLLSLIWAFYFILYEKFSL